MYVKCGWRNEYGSNFGSNERYLSSSENKAWKKDDLKNRNARGDRMAESYPKS